MSEFHSTPSALPAIHQAALKIAGKGKPVFPCRSDKTPYTPHGFKDASVDPGRVNAYWNRHRGAKIGMPTGSRSGVFVVDVDRLEALGELPRELPETLTVRTPSGGLHFSFKHVDGLTNRTGRLPDGIHIRAEGGYVILPPSEGYVVESRSPMAEAPAWLLELIRDKDRETGNPKETTPAVDINLAGGIIPEGQRNETLTRICGKLHDGTRSGDQLAADLLAINHKRCSPPLPAPEVRRIVDSISRREPCKRSTPTPEPEVLEDLNRLAVALEAASWRGMGGKSARDLLIADIKLARRYGRRVPAGVRVEASVRQRALAAGMGVGSVIRASKRLKAWGWQRADNHDRSGTQAGAFALLTDAREVEHSSTELASCTSKMASVPPCAHPYSAPRLRWSAPSYERVGSEYVRGTIRRLGKSAGQVVDILEGSGGTLALDDLYGLVYPHKDPSDRKRWRPRDLRRRVISRLEAAGVVEVSGDTVSLVPDWLEALNRERELAGEIDTHRRDMARYARDRDAHREWMALSPAKRKAIKEERRRARADGFIEDLEPVEDEAHQPEAETESWTPLLSDLALAMAAYLERNPHDADQPPGWIGTTLWAYDLYPGKPTPGEVQAAIDELGGEAYRRELLKRAKSEVVA